MKNRTGSTAGLTPLWQPPGRSLLASHLLKQSSASAWNALRSRRAHSWARFILLLALFLQAPPATGQAPPFPPQPHLTPDVRSRLSKIARDSTLAPWQRDYKLWVERHGAEDTATMPSAALRSTGLRSGGLTADDGAWVAIPPPIRRYGSAAIYDPLRDRMVVLREIGRAHV